MRLFKFKKAGAILEYGIVLFIVGAVVVAMQHELRRTYQGRIKSLSDKYIEEESKGVGTELTGAIKITDENGNFNTSSIGEGAPAPDIIDYADKPPEIEYPDLEYRKWAQRWDTF